MVQTFIVSQPNSFQFIETKTDLFKVNKRYSPGLKINYIGLATYTSFFFGLDIGLIINICS